MRRAIIGGMVGNALEWYDYALYAQFSHILALHFFPESDIKEMLAFAVFAAGFIVRPLGGVVFGMIGDRFGRKTVLVVSILTMAIPTTAIGLLPSYHTIGILAPVLLTITRILQGFSLGGEFSICITYLVECSNSGQRGLIGSVAFMSMCIGMLLGSLSLLLLSYTLTEQEIIDWGWRMPFIFGFVIALIGMYIRSKLSESPLYKVVYLRKANCNPISKIISDYKMQLILGMSIYITVTLPFYTLTVFIETFLKNIGYTIFQSSNLNKIILITMIIVFPISATISDRFGRRFVLIIGSFMIFATAYPCFYVLAQDDIRLTTFALIIFSSIVAFYMGPVPTVLVELFPTEVRLTGVALSYNISAAFFGGTAPMIGMMITQITGDKLGIAYYIMTIALFSLCIILNYFKETYKNVINE